MNTVVTKEFETPIDFEQEVIKEVFVEYLQYNGLKTVWVLVY